MSASRLALAFWLSGLIHAFAGSMTYTVTLNSAVCHEVHTGRFTLPREAAFLQEVNSGHCRVALRSGREMLLYVGVICLSPRWLPAPEKYAVDLSTRTGTRRISEAEWQSATELPWIEGGMFPNLADDSVRYKGPPLRRSGPKWMGITDGGAPRSHLSRTGSRVAVNSWDGFETTYSFLDPTSFGKRDKVKGEYWVDIYETSSGRPLVRIQGSFHGAAPSRFEAEAAWYSDRYYVMPVGGTTAGYEFDLRRLLICDADAASREDNTVLKERK